MSKANKRRDMNCIDNESDPTTDRGRLIDDLAFLVARFYRHREPSKPQTIDQCSAKASQLNPDEKRVMYR